MKAYLFSLLACATLFVTSCSPVLYSPTGQNVPLFREKGEAILSAGIGASDTEAWTILGPSNYAEGFCAQAAVAVDSNFAIVASFYEMKDREEPDAEVTGHGAYFEAGIGKFWPINNSKWVGEVFIGAGLGSIKNLVNGDALDVQYVKPFIQPSIGYRGNIFEFAFTPKIAVVNYAHFNNQIAELEQHSAAQAFYQNQKTSFAIEPGFTYRIGWKNIKFQLQTNFTTLSYSGWEGYEAINKVYFGLGAFLRIPPRLSIKP